jgi:PAS domain S-box-containing protein
MDSSLAFLLDKSTDFLCVLDSNGVIIHTNTAFNAFLGYAPSALLGKKIGTIIHPADLKRQEDLLKELAVIKKFDGYESHIKSISGCYYNIIWSVVLSDEDNLVYATGSNLALSPADESTATNNFQHVIQSFKEGFFIINNSWQITAFNPAFQAITGLTEKALYNISLKQLDTLGITSPIIAEFEKAFINSTYSQVQFFNKYLNRWLRVNIYPYQNELMVFVRDVTDTKIQQLVLALEKRVLELNASTLHSLGQTINELLKGIEEIFPDMICSVLEVDDDQEKLYHLAGPRLPKAYCDAVNGMAIGPKAGSCGAAAYHRSQVIVSDIETSPLWVDYKHLILPYGLKACWSTPIISSHSSKVLATFAIYYTAARKPKAEELQLIERTTNILRVLIENKKSQEHVQNQNKMLQEIASISSHEIRRPVATILGLVNLFDQQQLDSPMNKEIMNHLEVTAKELDSVIHTIVEKTIYLKSDL